MNKPYGKKAVLIEAGKIGRGIIAKSLINAGFALTMLDTDQGVISLLGSVKCYKVRSLDEATDHTETVSGYQAYALASKNAEDAICEADIIFVSAGVNNLSSLMHIAVPYLIKRIRLNRPPVDMVFCENIVGVRQRIEDILNKELDTDPSVFSGKIAFAGGSVGVVVPPPHDPLCIVKGPYEDIDIEEAALITPVRIPHFVPVKNFELCIREKLYIYNMAHALASYIGWLFGFEYVDEAFDAPEIIDDARGAMRAVARALSSEYDVPEAYTLHTAKDIERRIRNRRLRDTVERIGEDPIRKLGFDDRLVGAYRLTEKYGFGCDSILKGIAAGFLFDVREDEASVHLQNHIRAHGIQASISAFTGITNEATVLSIIRYYDMFKRLERRSL